VRHAECKEKVPEVFMTRLAILFFCSIFVMGCGSDGVGDDMFADASIGNEGNVVGGPCQGDLDCADGSYCAQGGDFPDGTCTVACLNDLDCPEGTACIDRDSGICLLLCHFDQDCRREYECKDKSRRGHSGSASVCIE
jgi:hypothetical protein